MSELNPEGNQDFDAAFDTIITGLPMNDFLNKLKDFDNARRDLYVEIIELKENLEEYSAQTDGETARITVDGIAEELGSMAYAMITGGHVKEDIVDTMSWTIYDDVEERATTMNELLGSETIIVFSREKYAELIEDIFEQNGLSQAAVEILEGMYHLELSKNVDMFIHKLTHPADDVADTEAETIQEITLKKDLREHMMDIGKIAAGATIALAINKLFGKRG